MHHDLGLKYVYNSFFRSKELVKFLWLKENSCAKLVLHAFIYIKYLQMFFFFFTFCREFLNLKEQCNTSPYINVT